MSVFGREFVFLCVGFIRVVSVCVCSLWFLCYGFAADSGVVETILSLVLMIELNLFSFH